MLSPAASTSPSPSEITPWLTFTQAPTAIQLAIHSIPTHILPGNDEHLFTFIKNSIYNAKEVEIGAARYLNKDRAARRTKQATSVVVSVNLNNVPILLPALFLFSKGLKVEKTMQANRYTQCTNCYRFGHAAARCTQKHPTCPYCALHHTRSAHRCQNPTCPTGKGGDTKAVSGCCPTSPPHCPNCSDDHDAFFRQCRARPIPLPQPEAPPPSDEEVSDAFSDSEEAMDVGDDSCPAPTIPKAPSTQAIELHRQKIIMRLVCRCCVRMLGVGNFAPVTPGAFCGGLRHSLAPGASGGTVASTLTSGC